MSHQGVVVLVPRESIVWVSGVVRGKDAEYNTYTTCTLVLVHHFITGSRIVTCHKAILL